MFIQLLAACLLLGATAYPQNNNNNRGGARSNNDACEKPGPFEEMRLSMQWTKGSCKTSNCKNSFNDFTIHGMWPSNNSGEDPQDCCGRPFNMRDISHLQSKLNKHWPSIHGDDVAYRFWSHEWRKHGTCGLSSPVLQDQKEYFEKTLKIVENMPLLHWLEEANIFPRPLSEGTTYSLSSLHQAIESRTGSKVYFDCTRVPNERIPVLAGVYVCFDPKTLKYIDCKRNDLKRCGGRDVKIPSN